MGSTLAYAVSICMITSLTFFQYLSRCAHGGMRIMRIDRAAAPRASALSCLSNHHLRAPPLRHH
jgi:hypothetical protein